VTIYVAAVVALREKERQDETQFTAKIDGFLSFILRSMLIYFFCRFFFNLTTLCMTKLRVLVLCFSYFTDNFNYSNIVEAFDIFKNLSLKKFTQTLGPSLTL
jgi:hypothetical protein